MMEEYEMNSEPSDRQTHVQDEHDYGNAHRLVCVSLKVVSEMHQQCRMSVLMFRSAS